MVERQKIKFEDIIRWESVGEVWLLNKPLGWTSFDVVNKLKWPLKKLSPKLKIGHAGTLDPLADGLLVVCIGKKTKTIEEIQIMPKTYIAELTLGATTPSYDLETTFDQEFDISDISEEQIRKCISSFEGEQLQTPPIFSAVKQAGKPVYLKARKGDEVIMTPKTIHIYSIEVLKIDLPKIEIMVKCSKGTYIRSLANDIGKRLNSGAHLSKLKRTAIGHFELEKAWEVDKLTQEMNQLIPKNNIT